MYSWNVDFWIVKKIDRDAGVRKIKYFLIFYFLVRFYRLMLCTETEAWSFLLVLHFLEVISIFFPSIICILSKCNCDIWASSFLQW